jgi:hypothetical protein
MLADAAAAYATATGTDLDLGAALGNMRLSGFPLLAEDGVISQFNEADNTGLNCSLATPRVDSLGSVNETQATFPGCGRSVCMEGQCTPHFYIVIFIRHRLSPRYAGSPRGASRRQGCALSC